MRYAFILSLFIAFAALAVAGCSVDVAGAPCSADENCPTGQVCGEGGKCGYSKGGEKDSGAGEGDTGSPAGDAGGTPDGAVHPDAGAADSGATDTGATDAGDTDGMTEDAGGDTGPGEDAEVDGGTDGGGDTGDDVGGDAGTDAGSDGGLDAGSDAGSDAGFPCISDQDCGGAHCCTGVCAPADRGCCDQQDCLGTGEGILCIKLTCQCKDEWDCPGTERICNKLTTPPSCVDGCTADKCGAGKACCGIKCFAGECCDDKDCTVPGKPTCKTATHLCADACKPGGTPCGTGFLCCTDTCKKGDCCADADCEGDPSGTFCVNNTCATKCTVDGNCPGGKCCLKGPFSGSCYTGACCDDSQCVAPETCGGGGTANACGCTSESKAAFCTRMGAACGSATGKDNCGTTRTEDCGTCQGCASLCQQGTCIPVSHANIGCDGGDVWWFDSCWTKETMKTDCVANEVCTGPACCLPETDPQFCARLGKNCNVVSAADNCGTPRTANCGLCMQGWTCGLHVPNVCGCDDDGHACDGRICGTARNNCGTEIACGMCPMNSDCCEGKCVNLQTDRLNCQTCGKTCEWDEVCLSGCTPKPWEPSGGGPVNALGPAVTHALASYLGGPAVAWVGPDLAGGTDGGMSSRSVAAVHQVSGGTWKQVGGTVNGALEAAQAVIDLQVKNDTPHVLYAETNTGYIHLKLWNGNAWNEPFMSYDGPCMVMNTIALAPMDFTGIPNLTSIGAGGCGMGVGYAYWNANLLSWWDTPTPPAPMKGLITMSGVGASDIVNDGSRALVALAEYDPVGSTLSIGVKYWNTIAWTGLGPPLYTGPQPTGFTLGTSVVSIALNQQKQPTVAHVEEVGGRKTVKVNGYDGRANKWIAVGGGVASGTGAATEPSLTIIEGLPYVAFVETGATETVVQVRRYNGSAWQRVGAPITAPQGIIPKAPYLAAIDRVPYVAFRQPDGTGVDRIWVVAFIPPAP